MWYCFTYIIFLTSLNICCSHVYLYVLDYVFIMKPREYSGLFFLSQLRPHCFGIIPTEQHDEHHAHQK